MSQQKTDESRSFEELSKDIDIAIKESDLDSLKKIASEQDVEFKDYVEYGKYSQEVRGKIGISDLDIALVKLNLFFFENAPEILKLFIENDLVIKHENIFYGIGKLFESDKIYENLKQATSFLETILDCGEKKQFDIKLLENQDIILISFRSSFMYFMEEALREDNELNPSENKDFVVFLKALSVLSFCDMNIADIICRSLVHSDDFFNDPAKDVLDFLLQSEIYPRGKFFWEHEINQYAQGIYSTVKYLHEKNVDFFAQRGDKEFDTIFSTMCIFAPVCFTPELLKLFIEIHHSSETGADHYPIETLQDTLISKATMLGGNISHDESL